MNWILDVLTLAKSDLADIRDYYESLRVGLGDQFTDAMEDMFQRIV